MPKITDLLTLCGGYRAMSPAWPSRLGMSTGRLLARRQKMVYRPRTLEELRKAFPADSVINLDNPTSGADLMRNCRDDKKVAKVAVQLHEQATEVDNTVDYLNLAKGHGYVFRSQLYRLTDAQRLALEETAEATPNLILRALISGFVGGGGELEKQPATLWEKWKLDEFGDFQPAPDLFAQDPRSAPSLTQQRIKTDEPVSGPVRLGNAVITVTGARIIGTGHYTIFTQTAVTSVPHPLDGVAQWMMVWNRANNTLTFNAIGVGENPLSIIDGFNVPFAGSVFLTMFRSFRAMLDVLPDFVRQHPDLTSSRKGLAALNELVASKDSALDWDRWIIDKVNWWTFAPAWLREVLGPQIVGTPAEIPMTTGAAESFTQAVDAEADHAVKKAWDDLTVQQLSTLPALPNGESLARVYQSDIEAARIEREKTSRE